MQRGERDVRGEGGDDLNGKSGASEAPVFTPAGEGSGVGGPVLDWRAVAKAAGEHGVRYRTNAALERFFAAVLPHIASTTAAAVLDEREACAKLADSYVAQAVPHYEFSAGANEAKARIATAILARSEASEGGGK